VKAALAHGASSAEIVEAAFVAVIMDGGPALAHMGLVLDAIEAHKGDSH
jgi:alkylhydroperoxidase/carboxymuconolactone decarboxylase family protein YurZ